MAPKRAVPFKKEHELKYGVRISSRDAETGAVVSVVCQFCVSFGREVKVGAKRARTANVKYFKKPFRADNYITHLTKQHPHRWGSFKQLSATEKETFFQEEAAVPFKSTLYSHFDGVSLVPMQCFVNKSIVDVIIGDMLFNPDDVEGIC